MRFLAALLTIFSSINAIEIKELPIKFGEKRIELTKEYIKKHYGLDVKDITIVPKIIVVHHTGINDLNSSYNRFVEEELPDDRPDISSGGQLNVSTQFLVDTDGTIYSLMPETFMARHAIGINYSSIGIENVGGRALEDNLTPEQLKANIELINYLKNRYPTIEYLIGHYEYLNFENRPLWLERYPTYKTEKHDPSERFMRELREQIKGLK